MKREDELLSRAAHAFINAWSYPLLRSPLVRTSLVGLIVALCGVRALCGLIDSRLYSHDLFMFLDGAWRMLNGQRPHIDFYSHLGFLTYLPTAIGLKLSHGAAWGMGYGHALVGAGIAFWAYLLGRKRLADVPFALFCVCILLLAIAPFALGEPILQISYVMTYNRFGYALLALLLLEAFVIPKEHLIEPAAGFSTGAIIGLLLFLKITYFVFALFLLFALLPCRQQRKGRWIGIAAGFALISLLCSAYFSFHLAPMLNDLRTVAGGKHIRTWSYMLDEIFVRALGSAVFAAIAALLLMIGRKRRRAASVLLIGVVVALTGPALMLGNFEHSGFPLGVFLALLVLNEIVHVPLEPVSQPYLRFSVMLLGSVFVAGSLFAGGLSTALALGGRFYIPHKVPALHSAVLSGFIPAGEDFWYNGFLNDGMALVRKLRQPGDTIMSLDFSNPFSYGLAMKPAPGGTTVLQYRTTFDDTHRQSAEALFGAAKLVAVPRTFTDGSLDGSIEEFYGKYLDAHFHLIGESRFWRLYRQN